jgi:D-aminopeptidase
MAPRRTQGVAVDERKIDALFASLDQCRLPGAAVGIAIAGRPMYRRGFGLANMELPAALTPSIRMRIGSVTKHFTALTCLLLCEQGAAQLDDPLVKYLPELHPVTHAVTMRQLLANTSGLRDVCDIRFQFSGTGGRPPSCAELVELYRHIDDVNAAPDSTWIYNNGGWLILSRLIEKITGQDLDEVFARRIFEPLGMHDTVLRRSETDFLPNSAMVHMYASPASFERQGWGIDFAGGGALVSTIDDLLRYLAHMNSPVVGTEATWVALRTPQTLCNGRPTGRGLGLKPGRYRGIDTLCHAGNWTGGNAQMLKVPSAALDVVVIANRSDVCSWDYVDRIIDVCIPELDAAPETVPASAQPFASVVFQSPRTGRVVQLLVKDGRQIASIDGGDLPVTAAADGSLWPSGTAVDHIRTSIKVNGDPERPASLCLDDFGNRDELVRVSTAGGADACAIAGRYRSDTTGSEVTIFDTVEGPRMRTTGRFGAALFSLQRLAATLWRARAIGGGVILPPSSVLSFNAESSEFRYSNSLTRNLQFRRCA